MERSVDLDRDTIERAFDEIARMAVAQQQVIDIAVHDGFTLVLCADARETTRDVDAIFLNQRDLGYRLADAAGRRLGLPSDWLNQAVKHYAPPKGNPAPTLLPFGEYPRGEEEVGLRVFTPTPEYLLAMKLLASRGEDVEAVRRDTADIHNLMTVTGIDTEEKLLALMARCYPNLPGVRERLSIKIEEAVANHEGAHSAAWNAGRGHPTL